MLLLATFLVAGTLEWLRLPGRAWNTLYAEDGAVFLQQWANRPSLATLVKPYDGYWHLVPRLAAVVVAATPVTWWAAAASAAACAIVAGVVVLVWVLSRDVFHAPWARATAALIPLLLPLSRLEAVGDLANLHSYLVYLLIFVLLARPRSRLAAWGLGVVAFAAAGTAVLAAFLLPLAIIGLGRDRSRAAAVVGWACGMAVQTWIFVSSQPRPRGGGLTDIGSGFLGWSVNAAASSAVPDTGLLGTIVLHVGWWPPSLALAALAGCAALAVVLGRGDLRLVAAYIVPLSAVLWGASYFYNSHRGAVYANLPTPAHASIPLSRWGIAAAMVLALAVPLAGQAWASAGRRVAWLGPAVAIVMVAVMAIWFDAGSTLRDQRQWTPDVAAARQTCLRSAAPIVAIPIMNWGDWRVPVPCSRLTG